MKNEISAFKNYLYALTSERSVSKLEDNCQIFSTHKFIKTKFNTEFSLLDFDEFGTELLLHLKRRNERCNRVHLLAFLQIRSCS